MKRISYLYITLTAIVAVLVLQTVWFAKNYRLLEEELFYQLNKAFLEAVSKEASGRYDKHYAALKGILSTEIAAFSEVVPAIESKVRWHKKGEENINDFMAMVAVQECLFKMDSIGIYRNIPDYSRLDSIFRGELLHAGMVHPEFRIDSGVPIDPVHYPYLNDLVFDSARIKNRHKMTTTICPTQLRYTSGYQATLLNPQTEVFRQLSSFLWGSMLLSVIIIFCVWLQIVIIRRQKKIVRQGEDFSYAMIHDMKTPLSSILMSVRILRTGKLNAQPDKKKKYTTILKDEGEHLLALSNKVLNLSKLEKHEVELNKEEVPLNALTTDLIEKFTVKAGKPVRFVTDLQAETAFADAEYLKEAISNLIDNAIKYSRESVDIHIVSSIDSSGMTQISVEDNGIGIPQKELVRVFEKFERSTNVRRYQKNGISGFGLGLNYVYRIIEAHGGNVTLMSEEGKFSKFTIKLPSRT